MLSSFCNRVLQISACRVFAIDFASSSSFLQPILLCHRVLLTRIIYSSTENTVLTVGVAASNMDEGQVSEQVKKLAEVKVLMC